MPYDLPVEVVRRAQIGDLDAQRTIADTYTHPFTVTARRFLGHRFPNEIEDAVQEIFLRIFNHIRDFDFTRGVKFSTWVYTFARNYCFDRLKSKKPIARALPALSRHEDDDPIGDWIDEERGPEGNAAEDEFLTAVEKALKRLKPDSENIFRLREYQGLEFHQIAKVLHQPIGTVKSKHYRACIRLRDLLEAFRPVRAA